MRQTAAATIRPMASADTGPAAELIRRGDWGERLIFFDWAVRQPTVMPLVAELDGAVVGTGVGSAHGRVGLVGTIFVAPERRGRTPTYANALRPTSSSSIGRIPVSDWAREA